MALAGHHHRRSLVVAMLTTIRTHLLTAAAVLLVLVGAYTAGSRAARRAAELQQLRERTMTTRKAREIKQNLDTLGDDSVRKRADRWVRGTNTQR